MKQNIKSDEGLAEFETVIERILAADTAAKEQAGHAEQERINAVAHVDVQKAELKEKYTERANKRIQILKEQEEAFATEKIAENEAHQTQRMEQLNRLVETNLDAWAGQLMADVLKD